LTSLKRDPVITEASVWRGVGVLGMISSVAVLRVAMLDFDAVSNSPQATFGDGLWAIARGVLSGFFFTIAAFTLVTAHVLSVMAGARHRAVIWLTGASALGLTGIVLVIVKGLTVAARITAEELPFFWLANGFPEVVAGSFLCLVAGSLLLGERMATHAFQTRRQLQVDAATVGRQAS
jgi:hypothetical protein